MAKLFFFFFCFSHDWSDWQKTFANLPVLRLLWLRNCSLQNFKLFSCYWVVNKILDTISPLFWRIRFRNFATIFASAFYRWVIAVVCTYHRTYHTLRHNSRRMPSPPPCILNPDDLKFHRVSLKPVTRFNFMARVIPLRETRLTKSSSLLFDSSRSSNSAIYKNKTTHLLQVTFNVVIFNVRFLRLFGPFAERVNIKCTSMERLCVKRLKEQAYLVPIFWLWFLYRHRLTLRIDCSLNHSDRGMRSQALHWKLQ